MQEVTAAWGVDPGQQVRPEWMELCAWWVQMDLLSGDPVSAGRAALYGNVWVMSRRCRAVGQRLGEQVPMPAAGQRLGERVPMPAEEGNVAQGGRSGLRGTL